MTRFVAFPVKGSKYPLVINPDKVEVVLREDADVTRIYCVSGQNTVYIVDMSYHDVIQRLEDDAPPLVRTGTPPRNPADTYKEMVRLIKLDQPISAIAVAKTAFGLSVHEAKDLVEAIISTEFLGEKDELA